MADRGPDLLVTKHREGEMPLWYYRPLNPGARLTAEERDALVEGLIATFGERDAHHEHDAAHGH